ncbi:type I-G CRISPR-associated RAMP protein Csb1/Cas7g [Steroidobacter cummioxidans]|uniref:type I-G CRISPR-associated RAMP protein Csb1/Cas7g n=1 Tax=Steroidobacter cummioxidans TaxID=1803913 RepID=UPI00137AF490|nr:type I-U CRISPR-associated RAMP protein Csb1/Cas7u [Steroidobacter cummioxidans]
MAIRLRQRLLPEGGAGDKIFPPTFAGGTYCWEQRRIDGKSVPCVLLDSVSSQANRLEEALVELAATGLIELPRLVSRFDGELEDIGEICTLAAPHRVFDAIFRDSNTSNGKPFSKSELYKQLATANVRNATALFGSSPSALLFGCWDSTGAAGGGGNRFARAVTSEIVGIDAEWGSTQGGVRQCPLRVSAEAEIAIDPQGDWSLVGKSAVGKKERAKGTRPSEVNHGSILLKVEQGTRQTVDSNGAVQSQRLPLKGGVTVDYALQTTVVSLTALRRLRFPVASKGDPDHAARVALAALSLVAITAGRERGYWLRSRCGLVADGLQELEILNADGSSSTLKVDRASALTAYEDAVAKAKKAGLPWSAKPVVLRPQQKLVDLVRKSRQIQSLGG